MNILGGRLNYHQNNGTQWVFELPNYETSKPDKLMKLMLTK